MAVTAVSDLLVRVLLLSGPTVEALVLVEATCLLVSSLEGLPLMWMESESPTGLFVDE